MLPQPIGDVARPSPALLSAVYLWSRHLSRPQGPPEQLFLSSTLHHLAKDLSGTHPHRVIHSIQAEVLLSYYYLKSGKMLEGNHHADAALSLAIANNLHRIRSQGASTQVFAPPVDPIEENERIDAFWTVLVLNNHWSTIQESNSMYLPLQNAAVDTPWPIDSIQRDYVRMVFLDVQPGLLTLIHQPMLPAASCMTLQVFLDGRSVNGFSEKALLAKSSVLFEKANSIHDGDRESLIDALQSNFLPIDSPRGSDQPKSTRIVAQMLLYAAMIKLHRPFSHENESSYHKSITAASSIARLTRHIPLNAADCHVNPIIGVIWSIACETLLSLVGSDASNNELELVTSFDLLLGYIARFSEQNPLFIYDSKIV
ncbi:hypothetical protein DXG01_012259 [Tephrocybe rancida]|nr:hypothetical protein DXG01_012259 [Tephrocybe rancida]